MSAPLRIAFFDSWFEDAAKGSGTAAAIAGLARGLEALGHRVDRVRPRGLPPGPALQRLLYNAGLPLRLRRSGASYDLAVGFDLDGFLLRRPPARRYIVCLKGVAAEEASFESGWPRLRLGLLARLEGLNARRADRVLVTSAHSREAAARAYRLPPQKLAVVPEGIDLAPWDALRAGPGSAGPRRGGPVILSVARQYPRKNTLSLVEAMPAVRAQVPGARLRVVGGGPMLRALERRAAALGLTTAGPGGAAVFLGEVPGDEEVRREYLGADVFCLPSLQEGFGIAFLEAMAAGLPIVAARAGAVPEVAAEGEAALLAPPGDAAALAGALVRLLKDAELRARLGEGGRRRVRRYAWPEVARLFLAEAAT